MEDDLVCEYDSTWDTESDGDEAGTVNAARRPGQDKNKRTKGGFWSNSSSRNVRAAKDMQNYRHGYPNLIDEDCTEERMPNLKFYLNEIKSSPDDVSIETFHNEWKTDYKRLERVHSYIQWLFPLREPGVNYMAAELTKKEIQAFRENEEAKTRLVDSYELMLGFYGIQLMDRDTGEVKRADNWRERFANLERNMHNNLRITRILKSLGELGFEHYQAPLVRFFLEETLVKKNLSSVKRSVLDYFLFAVRDKCERRKLLNYAFQHFEPKDKFVWCPRRIQKRFKKKAEKRQDSPNRSKEPERDGKSEETPKQEGMRYEESSVDPVPLSENEEMQCKGSSVDPEPLLNIVRKCNEGSSVDLDSCFEGSSVDPPLNPNGPADNGEMNNSGSSEARIDNGIDEDTPENFDQTSSEAAQDTPQREIMEPTELPKGPSLEREVVLSPKHVLASSPLPKRAEKLPRTDDDVSVTLSDHELTSEDAIANNLKLKNMESESEKTEPMEVTAERN